MRGGPVAAYVAAIHMTGGTQHQHISQVVWVVEGSFKSGISTRSDIVKYIDEGNSVMVSDGNTKVSVGVVREPGREPYLRSHADGKWTDNLLAMPRY
jgi:hypothetical protein